jgi:hypothetical protein
LELLPGCLTPSLQEDVVRLGTWMPFERAAQELQHFRRTDVSRPTVQRVTEAAGAAYVMQQTAEVERIEREQPAAVAGPRQQFLSVDGAMVPLVGGEWAEVKTMVIGEVQPPVTEKGVQVMHTRNHSYFSRLTDADTFQRLALVETQRRGVETAQAVGAVTDGSEWIQGFVDYHRPDAVRILDFPHGAEHVHGVGQLFFGEGSPQAQSWLAQQLHELKHAGPAAVLTEVRRLVAARPEQTDMATHLAYLEKRAAHMQYPAFQAAGWPIGDGAVESANKLVVEARLKGSGMHWARSHVNAMLALRTIVCSDRWDEAWPQISSILREQARQRHTQRRHQRQAAASPPLASAMLPPDPAPPPRTTPHVSRTPRPASKPPKPSEPPEPRRPAANHPWRRMPVGRARLKLPRKNADAKS